jgi:hypothetical protein
MENLCVSISDLWCSCFSFYSLDFFSWTDVDGCSKERVDLCNFTHVSWQLLSIALKNIYVL